MSHHLYSGADRLYHYVAKQRFGYGLLFMVPSFSVGYLIASAVALADSMSRNENVVNIAGHLVVSAALAACSLAINYKRPITDKVSLPTFEQRLVGSGVVQISLSNTQAIERYSFTTKASAIGLSVVSGVALGLLFANSALVTASWARQLLGSVSLIAGLAAYVSLGLNACSSKKDLSDDTSSLLRSPPISPVV